MTDNELATAVAEQVVAKAGRPFMLVDDEDDDVVPDQILAVYFQPPPDHQTALTTARAVGAALADALLPYRATVPLGEVIGAAACERVVVDGLALRLTQSDQFDDRVVPAGRVEWRAEVGAAF